jgi:hypothetical protein
MVIRNQAELPNKIATIIRIIDALEAKKLYFATF